MSTAAHLQHKRWLISITNVCNLSCGGCAQLCGHFPADKIWATPLAEIEQVIRLLLPFTGPAKRWNELTIFGGEPTLHPQWAEIPALLHQFAPAQFRVNTNGRLGHTPFQSDRNITYFVDRHPPQQQFHPTMIAAEDVLGQQPPEFFWEKAQRDCKIWHREGAMIYNGKAYFCEHAAAMDWLFFAGAHGWSLVPGQNPFARTDAEIAEQAQVFCRHCGWCVPELPRQAVGDKTQITQLNYALFPRQQLVQLVTAPRK